MSRTSNATFSAIAVPSGPSNLAAASSAGSLEDIARYLTDGYWNDNGGSSASFDSTITVDLDDLTAEGQKLARWAFEAWERVADITFVETGDDAEITFDDDEPGAIGGITSYNPDTGEAISGIVNISTDWLDTYGTGIDSYSFSIYIHEIGHALGLGHPGNYDASAVYGEDERFSNDSWQVSVMSYFSQTKNTSVDATYGALITPMMADILAIQDLYGTPDGSAATSGNTVWGPGSDLEGYLGTWFDVLGGARAPNGFLTEDEDIAFTIYDRDGTDRIDLSFSDAGDRVTLWDTTFSDVGGEIGNLAIAQGTIIENLTTGDGDDTITGNDMNNVIVAAGGDDDISAGQGNDSAYGGAGNDMIRGGGGRDLLGGGAGNDTLSGGGGDDRLYGAFDDDALYGGAGNDTLGGFDGNDTLGGGDGDDELWGALDDDMLYGAQGSDTLGGFDGNDKLWGGDDNDELWGGKGNDVLHGQDGNDMLGGFDGNDELYGGAGRDELTGGVGDDIIYGGAGNDTVYAASGDDTIGGNGGDDVIFGGTGADTFVFTSGNGNDDVFSFSLGENDRLRLYADLWSGDRDADQIVTEFATDRGDDVLFDFGDTSFTLMGVSGLSGLDGAIEIV